MSNRERIAQLRAEAAEISRRGRTPTDTASTTISYVDWSDWCHLKYLAEEIIRLEQSSAGQSS